MALIVTYCFTADGFGKITLMLGTKVRTRAIPRNRGGFGWGRKNFAFLLYPPPPPPPKMVFVQIDWK